MLIRIRKSQCGKDQRNQVIRIKTDFYVHQALHLNGITGRATPHNAAIDGQIPLSQVKSE